MREFTIGLVLLALALPLAPTTLRAQTSNSVVVANCGTPPRTYTPGLPYPNTQDTTGTQCTKGGSGGAVTATITGPLGTQTSASSVAVTINPNGVTTTPTGYTVTTANTFQSVLAASATRKGCLLQNTNAGGGDVEYVFFGPNASATEGASIQVAPGGAVNCATGSGQVLIDNVSVTSVASGTDKGIVNAQ